MYIYIHICQQIFIYVHMCLIDLVYKLNPKLALSDTLFYNYENSIKNKK